MKVLYDGYSLRVDIRCFTDDVIVLSRAEICIRDDSASVVRRCSKSCCGALREFLSFVCLYLCLCVMCVCVWSVGVH